MRTIPCSYGLSSLFAPGDRHAMIGTKSGKIQIFDIGSGEMTEEISAHSGEVWSLVSSPDTKSVISGSSDKTVKFWDYELISGKEGNKILSLVHKRTLQVDEGVTCVSLSKDGRFIAVGLLDSTVKVFFVDSLKFFLSLYGHKLPVVAMDISTDSTLIVTGSADRNMKIWGLDFGDCHKSLFAHDDTITGLRFIPNTHMVFTCGKDGEVKQWDVDNFQRILTLKGMFEFYLSFLAVSWLSIFFILEGIRKFLLKYNTAEFGISNFTLLIFRDFYFLKNIFLGEGGGCHLKLSLVLNLNLNTQDILEKFGPLPSVQTGNGLHRPERTDLSVCGRRRTRFLSWTMNVRLSVRKLLKTKLGILNLYQENRWVPGGGHNI